MSLPRASCAYRGGLFEEMDLGALLARRPQVAIVDECAHSNVPGDGRNPRRRQDIETLLDDGIDMITTVLATADESMAKLNRPAENLLYLSRMAAGALTLDLRATSLEEVLPTALADVPDADVVDLEEIPAVLADPPLLER
ncbi:hypothetical protein GCM10010300_84750 [Streptomyces olivaceoviridis]|nr:hypothetical protein GCM10010300_84750 [Streptomyces olivaceoviridis]